MSAGGGVAAAAKGHDTTCYVTPQLIRTAARCDRGTPLSRITALNLRRLHQSFGKVRRLEQLDQLTALTDLDVSYHFLTARACCPILPIPT